MSTQPIIKFEAYAVDIIDQTKFIFQSVNQSTLTLNLTLKGIYMVKTFIDSQEVRCIDCIINVNSLSPDLNSSIITPYTHQGANLFASSFGRFEI